jgi:hypothetical protein
MTDLTILHASSTLYLPLTNETGLHFTSNRRSPAPRPLSTPTVTVEMVDTNPPPPPPAQIQDKDFLSPPRRTFRSKEPLRATLPRSLSAPPGRPSSRTRTIDSPNHSSRLSSPDIVSSIPSSIPVVPPTILCMCIFPGFESRLTYPSVRPKPFWRHTRRSAVTGTFYASSLHPIRRSTFIAAGLRFDKPIADLSALGVESRIGIVVLLPDSLP